MVCLDHKAMPLTGGVAGFGLGALNERAMHGYEIISYLDSRRALVITRRLMGLN